MGWPTRTTGYLGGRSWREDRVARAVFSMRTCSVLRGAECHD
jgi:hypothetical protein